jgi:peptidoglycan/LPS O-acetylase OafA/YrhL
MIQRSSPISRQMSLILDIIRFGAACLVLLHHAAFEKFGTYIPWPFAKTATEPVMAFFVLSGFVIALTAETNDGTAYQYLLSRATRLLSVTIPAVVLTIALDYLGSAIFPAIYAAHWTDAATMANLDTPLPIQVGATVTFMNQIWNLDVWPGSNSPFWSLGYEAAYYLIFGVAYYVRRAWLRAAGLTLVCIVVGPKILLLLPIWLMGVGTWHIYKRAVVSPLGGAALCVVSTLCYVVFMASGARSALDYRTEVLTTGLPPGMIGLSGHFLSNYVSGALFSGVLIGLKGLEGVLSPVLSAFGPSIRAMARCTFSMYLYHYPLVCFFRAIAAVVGGQRELNVRNWTITGIVVIGTSLSIYLLARVTEQRKNEFRSLLVMMFDSAEKPRFLQVMIGRE